MSACRRLATLTTSIVLVATAGACGGATSTDAGSGATTTTNANPATTAGTITAVTTTVAPTTTTTADPGTLAQTDEKPIAAGVQWDDHTQALWLAIVNDAPDQARSFFFPLTAYRQVKGISDPDGDYQSRLIAYYEDDIHKLHKQLGEQAATAQLVKIDVPPTAQWIKPGVEYNKGPYWRVFDSKIVYTVAGMQKTMLVKSMISWRGQWYVVHLSSIR